MKIFYLKLPLEELTKENNNKKFHGLSRFLSMFWDQKVSESHIELYQLIPKRKKVVVGLDLNQILTLNFSFNNLSSIIIYLFVQGYLSS